MYYCAHDLAQNLATGKDGGVGNLGECAGCLTRDGAKGRHTRHCTRQGEDEVCSPEWTNATAFCSLGNLSEYINGVDGCEACYDPVDPYHGDGWNKGRSETDAVLNSLSLMRGGDFLALALVAIVVGLCASAEWADIKLSEVLITQRHTAEDPAWVKPFFVAVSGLRQFGFLPLLTATVPQLVAHRGSTSIDICFNGVAILFLMEIECVYHCSKSLVVCLAED